MTASELIEQLGGGNAIQKRFGYSRGAVYNWRRRGIPDRVLLDQPNWLAAMRGNAELVVPPPASAGADPVESGK